MKYNYYEEMKKDVKNYIKENKDYINNDLDFNYLYDLMFLSDSVTGNTSGSYTYNTDKAKEYVIDNLDLLKIACEEFGCSDILGEKLV